MFLRELDKLDLLDKQTWFDRLDCLKSWARQSEDIDMKTFLRDMTRQVYITLQIGHPTDDRIRYCFNYNLGGTERFYWNECPNCPRNKKMVSGIFENIFGSKIEENYFKY